MYNKDFLGSGWKYPLEIDPKTGHFSLSSHEDNIRESIEIILGTFVGERVMRPDFGTNTINYVFAVPKDFPAEGLSFELERALTLQEPRIMDVNVSSDGINHAEGSFLVNISYTVRSTNNRYNLVYPFFLRGDGTEV